MSAAHTVISLFVRCRSKANPFRSTVCQYYISLWCCFRYGHRQMIQTWENNSQMAAWPNWLIGLVHHFCWFPQEREKKNENRDPQWNAVLKPLQPVKLFISVIFFFLLVHILMCSHLDILSFAGQCACAVSHLMIPAWAARRKSHSSVSKSTSKRLFWLAPLTATKEFILQQQVVLRCCDRSCRRFE